MLTPYLRSIVISYFTLFTLLCSISTAQAWVGTVVKVQDGDTIIIVPAGAQGMDLSLRLYGIDTPELKQSGGKAAREALQQLTPVGSKVEVIPMETDKYQRTVALIAIDSISVNNELIKQGHAWVYPQFCKARFCTQWKQDQKAARAAKLGLWKKKRQLSPWEWRHKNAKNNSDNK